jgi:hypothetical protein
MTQGGDFHALLPRNGNKNPLHVVREDSYRLLYAGLWIFNNPTEGCSGHTRIAHNRKALEA